MTEQLELFVPIREQEIQEVVYVIPEFCSCDTHGEWNPRAFYSDKEIISDLEKYGWIDCPYCLCEIVGIEGF